MARSRVLNVVSVFALAGAALASTSGAVCRQDERGPSVMLTLAEKDNDRTVNIKVGDEVQVTLAENASTGYRWAVDRYDGEVIDLVSTQPHYTAGAVGSGGRVSFVFKGKKAGAGEIALKQWRSWEGESSVVDRFRVEVRIQP